MKQRILSTVLALCMMLMLPVQALALEEEPPELPETTAGTDEMPELPESISDSADGTAEQPQQPEPEAGADEADGEVSLLAVTSGECGAGVNWSLDDVTGTLTISGSGWMDDYTSNNHAPWYGNRNMISRIVIGDGVTSIGKYAFADCTLLESIEMSGVSSIGESAFNGCTLLDGVLLPQATIGDSIFRNCTKLKTVTLPQNLKALPNGMFSGCSALEKVEIPQTVESIGGSAFYGCTSLLNQKIPGSVTSIGSSAFHSCTKLQEMVIPSSVKNMGGSLFYGCSSLRNVTFSSGLSSIPNNAFWGCSRLQSVTIPRGVTNIGSSAFSGCTRLRDIYYTGSETQWSGITGRNAVPSAAELHYDAAADSTVSGHDTTVQWEFQNNVLHISGYGHMYEYGSAEKMPWYSDRAIINAIQIDSGITGIADYAFTDCTSINKITIPETVTCIGVNAFEGCSKLSDVVVSNADARIWDGAFMDCVGLKNMTLPQKLQEIPGGLFRGCKQLSQISIPASVTVLGDSAFSGCTALEDINLPDNLKSIGGSAFYGCISLLNQKIPGSVTSIGPSAFHSCTKLQEMTIPGSVQSLGSSLFYGCSNLRKVTLQNGVPGIPNNVFWGCSKLKSVTIPRSVNSIGSSAFSGCGAMDIYYTETEDMWKTITGINYVPATATIHYNSAPVSAVTGVALNKTELTLAPNAAETLSVIITPPTASNKGVTWSSSNPAVAEVSNGTVTAKSEGTTDITVTTADGGKTAKCTVTVKSRQLSRITLTAPSDTTVTEGMALDLSGLRVTAHYSDGTSAEVTDYQVSGYNPGQTGAQTVTVTYQGMTASFTVTAVARRLTGIRLTQMPSKRAYTLGESLSLDGMEVTAEYNNDTSVVVPVSAVQVSGYNPRQEGSQTVTVEYQGHTASFPVTVTAASAPSGTVAAPQMSISSANTSKQITLACPTSGAVIYYTLDGSVPTSAAYRYTGPFSIAETTTVKAVAILGSAKSSVTSGRITVSKAAAPVSSHLGGELAAGTVITLRSATGGATIYYTTDGSAPTNFSNQYNGSIIVRESVTIKAVAMKPGCSISDMLTVSYTVPVQTSAATLSLGSAMGAAGEALAIQVYIFTEEKNVTDFRFTVRYDANQFQYDSLSAADGMQPSDLFASAGEGEVTLLYTNSGGMQSGEMCTINLTARPSAVDGDYTVTVVPGNISVKAGGQSVSDLTLVEGSIHLSGSYNSTLTAETTLTDAQGGQINSAGSIQAGNTLQTSVSLEGADTAAVGSTAYVILAVYARNGAMVSSDMWEMNLSDPDFLFTNTIHIPQNVEVGSIKLIVTSKQMEPLMVSKTLAS